jgi:hypothetical protein
MLQDTSNEELRDPRHLLANPRALDAPLEVPEAPGTTISVYRAEKDGWTFNLHPYITWFAGRFWAMWSSGRRDEEGRGQLVRYASSGDGKSWNECGVLAHPDQTRDGPGICIARGLFAHRRRLKAFVAFLDDLIPAKAWLNLRLVRFVWDGQLWQNGGILLSDAINNFPPRRVGNHYFMTVSNGVREMFTAVSESLILDRWRISPLPGRYPPNRMREPSWYVDPRGIVHLLFRDSERAGYLFHSLSQDQGMSWSEPLQTDYPDATSKNFTGRLSNGWYFLISNPNPLQRDPLVISFSRDGWTFDHPAALRKNAPERRFEGRAKPTRTFQYPHAIEKDGSLWVIYSTNKEDIEVSEYPLSVLLPRLSPPATDSHSPAYRTTS